MGEGRASPVAGVGHGVADLDWVPESHGAAPAPRVAVPVLRKAFTTS